MPRLEAKSVGAEGAPSRNFRFFDNRQKYLLFVNTCGEKEVVARRVGMELAHLHPEPPAVRLFDAGMGDGTVLTRVMREMHRRFPTLPFYVVGKEISLEDTRLCLDKMADRFHEHPATVLVVTNMYYTEAPWLAPKALSAATSLVWHEVALTGSTAAEFSEQIEALEPFLAKVWQARHSPKTGNPVYERPVALVIYRDDFRFLLDDVIPRQGQRARRLRPRHRLAALSRARARRVQGRQGHRAADARAAARRAAARHPLLRPRSGPGDRPQDVARRGPLQDLAATTSCARCAPSSAATRATTISMPMPTSAPCSATTCTRCPPRSPPASAPRRCSPPGTPPSTWRRSTTSASAEVLGARRYIDATREVLQAHGQPVVSR